MVIGYYDQDNRELNGAQRVIDYIREVAERIETADGQVITASQMLEKFLFPADNAVRRDIEAVGRRAAASLPAQSVDERAESVDPGRTDE